MKLKIITVISLLMTLAIVGCSDEDLYLDEPVEEATMSMLQFDINAFSVADSTSRASVPSATPEPESAAEKNIRDFWMFQFNPDGTQLADPTYYSIPDDGATLSDLCTKAYTALTKNTKMSVYIVTNTGRKTWVSETGAENFNTLDKVKAQHLPSPFPIQYGLDENNDGVADDIYIPMSGGVDNVTALDGGIVVVPVTRMYAKIKIQVGFNEASMDFYYADITGIPWYSTITTQSKGTAANGEPAAIPFPEGTRIISRSLDSEDIVSDDTGKWLILYIPENIRGEIDNANKMDKTNINIPENALTVDIRSKYDGQDYYYTVYPGENNVNNFNIRRNCVYRVNINVKNVTDQHNPSSNCFIVKSGDKLSFEPYNRVEKGGGYDITDYLNPFDETKAIAYTKIIWQTKDCIGDNSTENPIVHYNVDKENPIYSKIVIDKVGIEGNALVGAYNSKDEIIWSWHIWVTPNEPDNLAKAVVYTTYRWDSQGIYPNEPRVPGYGIMPCNLGALAFRSEDDMPYFEPYKGTGTWDFPTEDDWILGVPKYQVPAGTLFPESQIRTFGMLYQWGRKDPFPPIIRATGTEDWNNSVQEYPGILDYSELTTGKHYGNDNKTEVGKTASYTAGDNLFYSKKLLQGFLFNSTNSEEPIQYSINHPTVYISGTNTETDYSETPIATEDAYNRYGGDWCGPDGSNGLWGGTDDFSTEYEIKEQYTVWDFEYVNGSWQYVPETRDGYAYLNDNYGEKSVFDPCPTGWRVPPGDLWLGFTETGLNPIVYEQVNYSDEDSGTRPGLSMFVQGWKRGEKSYFPLQGTRIYNGFCSNPGICGNYHNATCDKNNHVNILHLHRDMRKASMSNKERMLFKIFEVKTQEYYCKSTAGPIRCVRDRR